MADAEPSMGVLGLRISQLEERVAQLEQASAATGAPEGSAAESPLDAEKFWALGGLKARMDQPGAVLFTGSVRLPSEEQAEWQQGATAESLLDSEWEPLADALAALGHPVRLVLLREVLRGTRTATELGEIEGLGTSGQIYHHLRQLVAAGWLRTSGRGRYEVPATRVVPLLVTIAAAQR